MTSARCLSACAAVAALASAAAAQDGEPPAIPAENYRTSLYLACTAVFAAIAVYLVVSHRRASAVAADLERIERRIDELEKPAR